MDGEIKKNPHPGIRQLDKYVYAKVMYAQNTNCTILHIAEVSDLHYIPSLLALFYPTFILLE